MNEFSALFYPFAAKRQAVGLKVASLYFDKVYVLSPISVVENSEFLEYYEELSKRFLEDYREDLNLELAGPEALQHESVAATIQFQEEARPLIEEGVVEVVNPFDRLKSLSLEDEFSKIIAYRAKEARERSPEMQLGRGEYLETAVFIKPRSLRIPSATLMTRGLLRARTNAIRSIMYDAALLLSSRINTIPVTADSDYDRSFAMQALYGHTPQRTEQFYRGFYDEWDERLYREKQNREHTGLQLARESIVENLPSFEQASFKEILKVRRHCCEELAAFRAHMRSLAIRINESAVDEPSAKDVVRLVSKEITPVVLEMERRLRQSKAQWVKRLLDKLTSVQTLATFASTVFVGMPLHFSLIVAGGIAGLQAGADAKSEGKKIKEGSGLSLLVSLRQKKRKKREIPGR
jgi:hypothetical protein